MLADSAVCCCSVYVHLSAIALAQHVVYHVFGGCTVTIFCYKNQFLLHGLGYFVSHFVSYTYNFYTGEFVICLDCANIIHGMKHVQAYKFRIEPNGEQQRAMRRIAGTCRFVWNKALALQMANHQQGQTFVNHFDMCKWLPVWKKEPEPVNALGKQAATLAKYQRRLARKTKFSSNWKKQKQKISRLHHRVAHTRHDFLHKTSTLISKNHAMIVIEDLKVTNMSQSAAGTIAAPGRCVKAKSGLNKSILDQGWGAFRRQLEYKQAWRGGEVLAIDARNTSRTCPACKHTSAENRKTQAKFACIACGFAAHADLTAAINILRAGHARLACQVNGAIMPSATGTHRSDRSHPGIYAVGVPVLCASAASVRTRAGRMSSILTRR